MSNQDPISFYKFFGVTPSKEVKDNYVSDCPFINCKKTNHFYFNNTSGLYKCHKCNRSGNYYTFITQFHSSLFELTSHDYTFLSSSRGIPEEVFQLAAWVQHPKTFRWYVPYYGKDGLLNLGAFDPTNFNPKNRYRIFKTPGLDLQLYSIKQEQSYSPEIFITEGEWDALALYAAFRSQRKESPTILALPGSTSWKEEWNNRFKSKAVTFFFDNDQGGEQGIKLIEKRAKTVKYSIASWSVPELKKLKVISRKVPLKDVRDIWTNAKTKSEVLEVLMSMAANPSSDHTEEEVKEKGDEVRHSFSTDIEEIKPISSYSSFQRGIKESLYTNRSILQTIDAMLAVSLSVRMPGEPLWLFVVGPASCGKSTIIECFGGNNKYFDYSSKLTATSLVSGWRNTDGKDSSGIFRLNGKTLFIKDMTVLLGMPDSVQQQLWDLLRDAYDGYIKVQYGNGKTVEATDFKFNLIAGVTPIIHKHNDSSKGERFLKVDFLGSDFDEDEHMDQAWSNMDRKKENKLQLTKTMLGYYKYLESTFNPNDLPTIPEHIGSKVKSLAKLVARLSVKVEKDRTEGLIYRPVSSVATRYSLQFKNFIHCLAHVRGESEVSQTTYNIVRKVAFDTCPGLNFEVINYIHKHKSVTRKCIVHNLRIPSTRVHQILTDMEQVGILIYDKDNNGSGNRGRDVFTYSLSDTLIACLEDTHASPSTKIKSDRKSSKRLSVSKSTIPRKSNNRSKGKARSSSKTR